MNITKSYSWLKERYNFAEKQDTTSKKYNYNQYFKPCND